jgi:hypothetical protein
MNNQTNYSRVKSQPNKQVNNAVKRTREAFPVHCLDERLNNTVERVRLLTGMPGELIASALLTTLSIICQYLRALNRLIQGIRPLLLYLLTLAESGEGKTFLSRLFMKPVHQQLEK